MIDTTTSGLDHALALAALGMKVFPCRLTAEKYATKVMEAKSPRTLNGLYDATDDTATIKKWWGMWPDSVVGVAAGASGLLFLDGDIKGETKDFETALFVAGLTPDDTFTYSTPSGGKHYVYWAPAGVPLNGQTNYRGLLGVDRRGGASYAIWWGEVPYDSTAFSAAPIWLCDPVLESDGSAAFEGDVNEWLDAHLGNVSPLFRHIMDNDFPAPGEGEYEHDATLRLMVRIATLGAAGESGATEVLDALRSHYLADGYEEYAGEWDGMLSWAIKNVGGSVNPEVQVPAEQPTFMDVQAKLPADFDITLITAEHPIDSVVSTLKEFSDLTDPEILVLLKFTPLGKTMGDDELLAEIYTAEPLKHEKVTKPVPVTDKPKRANILTVEQRKRAKKHWEQSWLGEYEAWTRESVQIYNEPYHRAAAWMILSTMLGECAFVNIQDRDVPLNLYFMVLGPTTSGKSQAKKLMQRVVHGGMTGGNPDLGDNVSKEALQEKLRLRAGKTALLNSDEVDGLLMQMRDKGGWHSDLMSFYTYLYDGDVPPQHRRGDVEGEWSTTVFGMFGMGTEVAVMEQLDRKMFLSGFLARFQWFIGESVEVPQELLGVKFGSKQRVKKSNDIIGSWGARFTVQRERWGFRSAHNGGIGGKTYVWPDSVEVEEFLHKVTSKMEKTMFRDSPNADILTPSLTRLDIAITKMAALFALSAGRDTFIMDDVLVALFAAEEMLGNLEYIASRVASSDHSKLLDSLESLVRARVTANLPDLLREMSRQGYDGRQTESLLGELVNQNRIRKLRLNEKLYAYEIERG